MIRFSYVNFKECEKVGNIVQTLVGKYLNKLNRRVTQNDIGIVTPYRGQCRELSRYLFHFNDIFIGTTEAFQGSEKPIIIITTVRVGEIGFVKDPRVNRQFLFVFA